VTEPNPETLAAPEPPKPLWRGRLHQIAFFCSLPLGVALVALARGATAKVGALVYALTLAGMFGVSAAYHRRTWAPRALTRMKRLDHSMIYLLIAGTYTPLALLVLHGPWRFALLGAVWAGALFGIALKVIRIDRFQALGGTLYILLGWLAVVAAPQFVRRLPVSALTLILVGGVLYTVGALVLNRKRPNPNPRVFGYHEVWHSFMVSGSLCHYLAILLVLLTLR
jgi:hemolysin III